MNILLLHNPTAGNDGPPADTLRRLLRDAGHTIDYHETDARDPGRWIGGDTGLIAIAGGDGTVADVLRGLRVDAPPVVILPLGTANNLASSLGFGGSIESIIAGMAGGRTIAIDVGRTEGLWGDATFFESVGLGVIAHALGPVNAKRLPGQHKIPQGIAALLKSLDSMAARPVRLVVDGVAEEVGLLMLEVMNLPTIGPQLRFAPAAHPGDGCLHVVTVTARQRTALVDWIAQPLRKGPPPFTIRTAQRVEAIWEGLDAHVDDAFHLASDGEMRLVATLAAGTIRVRVPR